MTLLRLRTGLLTTVIIPVALACTPKDGNKNEDRSKTDTSRSTTEETNPKIVPPTSESAAESVTGQVESDDNTETSGTSGTTTEDTSTTTTEDSRETEEAETTRPTSPDSAGTEAPPAADSTTEATETKPSSISLSALNTDDVKQLQTALNQRGSAIRVDGIVGPETRQALTNFQTKNGLSGVGELTPETIAQLGISSDTIYAH